MSFLTELRFEDLQRLRAVVRQIWMADYREHHCTVQEIDRIIEAAGQEASEALLKRAVDARLADSKKILT